MALGKVGSASGFATTGKLILGMRVVGEDGRRLGLGTAFGALVGSLVVGLFVQLSTLFIAPELKNVGALVVLIVVLIIRPQGILGRRSRVG